VVADPPTVDDVWPRGRGRRREVRRRCNVIDQSADGELAGGVDRDIAKRVGQSVKHVLRLSAAWDPLIEIAGHDERALDRTDDLPEALTERDVIGPDLPIRRPVRT
jgi:hypothetical protein